MRDGLPEHDDHLDPHRRAGTPVIVLASTDPLLRDLAIGAALLEVPGLVAVTHELTRVGGDQAGSPAGHTSGTNDGADDGDTAEVVLIRRVSDLTGLREHSRVEMEHACAGCAMREDAVPTIARLLDERPPAILLALPLDAEILPATRTLGSAKAPGGPLFGARLGSTVSVAGADGVLAQLAEGRNSVPSQVAGADIVLAHGEDARGRDVIDALRWRHSRMVEDVWEPWAADAAAGSHDDDGLEMRCDPTADPCCYGLRKATHVDGAHVSDTGVWTLELASERPFHPGRMLGLIPHLAPEGVTSRGVFWVPNRPDSACGIEAVDGSVIVGVAGPWEEAEQRTHLHVVGYGDASSAPWRAVRRAFEQALLDDDEARAGLSAWLGRPDPLAQYLGDPADLYRTAPPAA